MVLFFLFPFFLPFFFYLCIVFLCWVNSGFGGGGLFVWEEKGVLNRVSGSVLLGSHAIALISKLEFYIECMVMSYIHLSPAHGNLYDNNLQG